MTTTTAGAADPVAGEPAADAAPPAPARADATSPSTPNAPQANGDGGRPAALAPSTRPGGTPLQTLRYSMTRSDKRFGATTASATFEVTRRQFGSEVEQRWDYTNSNAADEVRSIVMGRDAVYGQFVLEEGGEWTQCAWSPAVTYVPALRVGASATLDSRCDWVASDGFRCRDHLTGQSKVTGTKDVTIDGKRHRTWIVERSWKTVRSGDVNVEITGTATMLWSPELRAPVKHDATVVATIDAMRDVVDHHLVMDGLALL